MPTTEGVTCSISTSNILFTEYADCDDLRAYDADYQSGPIRSCYIESQEDQEFQVTIDPGNFGSRHPEATQFALIFSLDGAAYTGIASTIRFNGLQKISGLMKYQKGQWFQHHFKSGKLAVTEDAVTEDGTTAPQQDTQQLGEFRVMFHRFKHTATVSVPTQDTPERARAADKVHEKQLKGRDIAHAVGVGRVEKIPTKPVSGGTWLDPFNKPYMTFRFCYRSQHALKGLDMIPQTPPPTPTPSPTPSDMMAELTARSHIDLATEILQLRAERNIKRERSETVNAVAKTEERPKRRKTPGPAITIDLTGD